MHIKQDFKRFDKVLLKVTNRCFHLTSAKWLKFRLKGRLCMGLLTDGVVRGGGAVHVCPHPVHGLRLPNVHDAAAQARGVTRPPVPNLDR